MSLLKTEYAKGIRPMPVAQGSEVIVVRMEYQLAAALVANDIIELGPLPEDHVPVDFILDSDDLDTNGAPTITISAGILNAAKNDIDTTADSGGAAWIAASNVAQAGGIARPTTVAITRVVSKSNSRRSVGLKVVAGPATGAVAGKIAGTLLYRAASYGK